MEYSDSLYFSRFAIDPEMDPIDQELMGAMDAPDMLPDDELSAELHGDLE